MEHLKSPREGPPGGGTRPPRRRAGTNLVLPWSGLGLPLQEHDEEEQSAAAEPLRITLTQPALGKGTGLASLKALRGGSPCGEHTPLPPRRDGRSLFLPWDGYRSSAIRVDSSTGRGGGGGPIAATAPQGYAGWLAEVAIRHPISEGRPRAGERELVEERTPLALPSSSIRWAMAD